MLARSTESIIQKLEKQEGEEGNLSPLLEFYLKLLRIHLEAEQHISAPKLALTGKAIGSRIEQGQPLVTFDELNLDWMLLRGIGEGVIGLFAGYPELFGEIPEALRKSGADHFLTRESVKAWFEGSKLPAVTADGAGESLRGSIIHTTLSPFLTSYSKALRNIDFERWRRRYCPVCGGSPDFAFLDKESGARWLLCSRCDTEWLFQRFECPGCGAKDQNALAYFTDDEGLYRLYVCELCQQYLKAIDLRQAKAEILLPLERWLTLDMDVQARERGYSPCRGQHTVDALTLG